VSQDFVSSIDTDFDCVSTQPLSNSNIRDEMWV
jgi:hypothetical protein